MNTTHEVPTATCPVCGHKLDRASGPDERPAPGDLSVCIECACVLQFDDDLQFVVLLPAEIEALPADVQIELFLVSRAIAAVNAEDARRARSH